MPVSIMKSVGRSNGYGANLAADVKKIQQLLSDNAGKLIPLRPADVTGQCDAHTITLIEEFQRRVVKMARPDGRVDPGGRTLQLLNQGAAPAPPQPAPTLTFKVTFQHHAKKPPSKSTTNTSDLYESTVTVAGPKTATFRGSIFPDDMSVKGRIKDGSYPISLGFHKRAGHKASAADLVARSDGFRAALIVNNDASVGVISDNPSKTTSSLIHIHNGYKTQRYSDGCPTLHPEDWKKFIQLFLDSYPNLSNWTSQGGYVGIKIGTLEVMA